MSEEKKIVRTYEEVHAEIQTAMAASMDAVGFPQCVVVGLFLIKMEHFLTGGDPLSSWLKEITAERKKKEAPAQPTPGSGETGNKEGQG